jgi:hypothetical protein
MSDQAVVLTVVLSFAIGLTAHVAIAVGLARRLPRWRGALAFFAPPLAPYWAFRSQMPVRALLWIGAACAYVAMRALFRR